jgi:hypothetical protein
MSDLKDRSTIGLKIGIAFETTAGERPTSDYIAVPKVYELPDMDADPDSIDTTTFDNLKYKSSIEGLIDLGGILSLTANYTTRGVELWDTQAGLENSATNTDGKKNWLVIQIPDVDNAYFIPVNVIETGIPTTPVNDRISIKYRFTVVGDIVIASAGANLFSI